ncbi:MULTISPECIES: hypothetical protein [unclassified Rhizobium]|uniref:hypothetical protein n=1 Tax=unclassified Rhizobium TaxID=2613769 RepID=UPI001ADC0E98|nr:MULTISPECIES: hypothetical protein [unclassified Rhizobium]MBO9126950.1 hypothetical protein [Rhizobium sp. 16-488-2b]MBO9177398.1 hypothetical protein [Rhizobium sp. 16-488-2a]
MKTIVIVATAICLCSGNTLAWERKTVGEGIEKMCEARFLDDWPSQSACISLQWEALKSMSPPNVVHPELQTLYQQCKAENLKFDFAAIQLCYSAKEAELEAKKKATQVDEVKNKTKAQEDNFKRLPLVATCSDGSIVVRQREDGGWNILVKVGDAPPVTGFAGDYVYSWGSSSIEVDKCIKPKQ